MKGGPRKGLSHIEADLTLSERKYDFLSLFFTEVMLLLTTLHTFHASWSGPQTCSITVSIQIQGEMTSLYGTHGSQSHS